MNREERLILNGHFRPSLDVHFIIVVPLSYYLDDDRVRRFLPVETFTPGAGAGLMKREVLSHGFQDDDELEWYRYGVVDVPIYINAAFRSSRKNEAYIFMNDEYALMNYAPGTTDDRIVNGPLLICDGFPSLIGTPFGEHGIDCAFDTDYNKAYIFSGNICAYIDYAPGTTDDKILSGPMSIGDMFPCLKATVYETGIDTAFRSSRSNEAYLFSGGQYVILNYASKTVVHTQIIRNGYPSLVGTVFETGIDAAFASHRTDEAYIFKGEHYALINFAPGTTDDYLLGGVKPILPNWPSLRGILPRKNGRLDFIKHEARPQQSHYQYDL